jgi:hypothetical protein
MAQEVEVKIKVDTGQAVTDVNKLGNAFDNTAKDAEEAQKSFSKAGNGVQVEQSIAGLKQLKRELKNVAVGSEEFKKLYNDIDDLEDKLKSAKNTSSDWIDSLEQAGGPIGMLGAGLNKAKVATQSFGGALKATGIGLIVGLLGGLVSAFQGNESAMKKIQPLFDGLKKITFGIFKAVEPLVDIFMDLAMKALPYVSKAVSAVYSGMMAYFTFLKEAGGGAMQILKGVFTLDGDAISAGMDKVTGSFGKAGDTYKKSMKAFGEGQKQLTESEKEALEKQKELQEKQKEAREKAQADAEAKRLKEIEDRKAFNKEILDMEKESAEKIRDLKAKTEQEQLDLEERRDLERIQAIQKRGGDIIKLMEQHNQEYALKDQALQEKLAKEKADKQKENDDKAKEEQKEKDQKALDDKMLGFQLGLENDATTFEGKKQLILDREALLLEDQKLTENQRTQIHKESVDAQMQIDDLQAKAKIAQANEASETLGKLSDLAGKDTAAGKALGIASALINTYVGASEALKQKSTLPSPFDVVAKVANVATILATGFKTVKAITSVKVPGGGGGGGGSAPSLGGISAPSAMSPAVNVVGASSTNAIAQTIAQQGQQPIKAYVVANDVTTQQSLDRNIVSSASIG